MPNANLPPVPNMPLITSQGVPQQTWQNWFRALGTFVNQISSDFAPTNTHYIIEQTDASLPQAFVLANLPTGFLQVHNATGVLTSTGNIQIQSSDIVPTGVSPSIYTVNSHNLFTVNAEGQITSAANVTLTAADLSNGTTGTGLVVLQTSPTLITPLLGTPTSGVLTNCTGYTDAHLSLSDITTNNVTITAHGFAPKAPNDATKFLDGTGAYSIPPGTGSSKLINRVSTQTGAVATGTTAIPIDDTIPQNTEGDQYLSVSITPSNSANILTINCTIVLSCSAANQHMGLALFQDSTANALAATNTFHVQNGVMYTHNLCHTMTAGTTSATTFKIRAGGDGVSTTTVNGISGSRFYGGVLSSTLTITETSI